MSKLPVVIDLETLGTAHDSVILSIGAVEFDPSEGTLGREFYVVINTDSCLNYGRKIDTSTVEWWNKQSEESRQILMQAEDSEVSLPNALNQFAEWYAPNAGETVWGCGSDFDNVLLSSSYAAAEIAVPWKFFNNRCYRTMKGVFANVAKPKRQGVHHNALDDAKFEALHLLKIYEHIRSKT